MIFIRGYVGLLDASQGFACFQKAATLGNLDALNNVAEMTLCWAKSS